jgi:iron complex outermembrane recepter protein
MKQKLLLLFSAFLCLLSIDAFAQKELKGIVIDANGFPLNNATVQVKGTVQKVVTDETGKFAFINVSLPAVVIAQGEGFKMQEVTVAADQQYVRIKMESEEVEVLGIAEQVVTGASRQEERLLEAGVSIQRLNASDIDMSPAFNFYETLGYLKGTQMPVGSIMNTTLNSRGYADMNNFRVVQQLDGMDITSPGFGCYGNLAGVSALDVKSMEFVPGAFSALYGADAFNGILLYETKDPFTSQGLSFMAKAGANNQVADGYNGIQSFSLRYAKALSSKFAIKVDAEYIKAHDWLATNTNNRTNNKATYDTNGGIETAYNPNSAGYDAVNIWGDRDSELNRVNVTRANGSTEAIYRSGYPEINLLPHEPTSHRVNIGLYYQISPNYRLSYVYKNSHSDVMLRHTTNYYFDWSQTHHKIELKGKNLTLRGYYSGQNSGNTYSALVAGSSIQRQLLSNDAWGQRFVSALDGKISGVSANNYGTARTYADAGMADLGSPAFEAAKAASIANPNPLTGGAKLEDYSSFMHGDLIYNFADLLKNKIDLQGGLAVRNYSLNSKKSINEGSFYSDNRIQPTGYTGTTKLYSGDITFVGYETFIQAIKRLANDRLRVQLTARYAKDANFEGHWAPSASVVYTLDKARNHNFRATVQTGFRNPSLQEQFINYSSTPSVLILGGGAYNIDHFIDRNNTTGAYYDGRQIVSSFKLGGQPFAFKDLKAEECTTWELGYRGLIANQLYIDATYYRASYSDFIVRRTVTANGTTDKTYLLYSNTNAKVYSEGFDIGFVYSPTKSSWKAGLNYAYARGWNDGTDQTPYFNTSPHRVNMSLENSKITKRLGLSLKSRWMAEYQFGTPYGYGNIPTAFIVDGGLFYKLPAIKASVSLGANNLMGVEYKSIYGGGMIGSTYFMGIRFDGL